MVGLFKKLSKKKPRDSKRNPNVSEDESCTEDEGPEKALHCKRFQSPTSATAKSGNGICSVTPEHIARTVAGDPYSPVNSNSQISSVVDFETVEDDLKDSFGFDNDNEDDLLSIHSADEGSLFDEDILSQFQDGQISLQQFLQSPHLSRSEERIRDEEIDSFFSDSRSIESSNYYSDSSSGSNRTEQRDEELDRIAGEMFGDYGDKFSNTDDRFAIQKTKNYGDSKRTDRHSLDEYSIGEETIANSYSTLTITADSNNDGTTVTGANCNFYAAGSESGSFSQIHTDKETTVHAINDPRPTCDPANEELESAEIPITTNSIEQTERCSSARSLQGVKSKSPCGNLSFSRSDTLSSNSSGRSRDGQHDEAPKTLLDLVHERNKAISHEASKGGVSVSSTYSYSPIPRGSLSPLEGTSISNSRPASAQSQLSQREVSIIDTTVVSSGGQYVLPSVTQACKVQTKIDPWLSYLPHWKSNTSEERPSQSYANPEDVIEDSESSRLRFPNDLLRPGSAVPAVTRSSPSNLPDQDRYIRFSSLDLDFFIPPPPAEDDVVSTVQKADIDMPPSHLEWDYEIAGSPTITPSSSVIYIGNRENTVDSVDPIAESLLSLLPIDLEKFQTSVSSALGEIITEIVSSRQKILNLTRVLEYQDMQIKEQRKLIDSHARELSKISNSSHTSETLRIQRSPHCARRSEFRSYPATGRRSKELADLESTLDRLLVQCHSLQKTSNAHPDLQVLQPISREGASSRAESNNSDDSLLEVKALLCKKVPESPANHVQIVPAKGVVYNSCKEMKDDMSAIQK